MKALDALKPRGAKTKALLAELQSADLSVEAAHALDLILNVPHFVVECFYPSAAGGSLNCIEPTDSFERIVIAAKENNVTALIGEHVRLSAIKRKTEQRATGFECIAFEPSNKKQEERQSRERTFDDKLKAALGVAVYGAEGVGFPILFDLMWPAEEFFIYDVKHEAYRFLTDALDQALRTAPHHDLGLIFQASVARMEDV
ncbi:hypothetical protein [Neptunomonas japonica]|uniref:Uncharacterized protein n=1 Tax=Neptunomonas japonica JAMM 1380 TaxID=1441457 RepID=A0A7R6SVG1_9GAMM|nr:hypothetical protein [Neptunomonas japonica]BBB29356.1 hypothetical protein NEJAP_1404 [Neptunomonas japonica JAMM 1380]